jgi:hypothetical protein
LISKFEQNEGALFCGQQRGKPDKAQDPLHHMAPLEDPEDANEGAAETESAERRGRPVCLGEHRTVESSEAAGDANGFSKQNA